MGDEISTIEGVAREWPEPSEYVEIVGTYAIYVTERCEKCGTFFVPMRDGETLCGNCLHSSANCGGMIEDEAPTDIVVTDWAGYLVAAPI